MGRRNTVKTCFGPSKLLSWNMVFAVTMLPMCLGCDQTEQRDRPPVVTLVSPAVARAGTQVTISGRHFGIGGPRDGVFIGLQSVPIEIWSNTDIVVRLDIAAIGHRLLVVQTDGHTSTPTPIEILPAESPLN